MTTTNSTESPNSDAGVIRLNNVAEFTEASSLLIKNGIRTIDIISNNMPIDWLGNADVVTALKKFVLGNQRATIRILISNIDHSIRLNHPLVPLIKKISRIEARVIDAEILEKQPLKHEFILIDRGGIILKQKPDQYIGFAHKDDKTTVQQQKSVFEHYWRYSQASAELRYFSL